MLKKEDLFCVGELDCYRAIYDIDELRQQADKIFEETNSIDAVADFCNKIQRRKLAEKLKEKANLSKRFKTRTFANYKPFTPILKNALETAQKYAHNIRGMIETGTGLIFVGNGCVGTGKTHLAYAIANYALDDGVPVYAANMQTMVDTLKEFDPEFKKLLMSVEVLIVDDFGKEQGTKWLCSEIYGIINSRYENMLPTIITTEDSIDDVKENYLIEVNGKIKDKGKSLFSRLTEDFIYVPLTGEDYRQKREAA